MNIVVLYSVLLACLFLLGDSCKCAPREPRIIFCNTDWTSHVKIVGRYIVNNEDDNGGNALMFGTNILYQVNHIDTFKKPANETVLQNFIFTPQSGATCGIMGLEVNKEYLVSGSLRNGLLTISSCSQMHAEGDTDSFATPQEWVTVPILQKNMLKDGSYNNCTETVE